MKNTLLARMIGCFTGFSLAGAILPDLRADGWPMFLMGVAVMTPLYALARLITRPLALAFDLILFGLPCLLLEALVLWGIAALTPGITASGYWPAMGMLLLGVMGMYIGRISVEQPWRDENPMRSAA